MLRRSKLAALADYRCAGLEPTPIRSRSIDLPTVLCQLSTAIVGCIDARDMEHNVVVRRCLSRALLQALKSIPCSSRGELARNRCVKTLRQVSGEFRRRSFPDATDRTSRRERPARPIRPSRRRTPRRSTQATTIACIDQRDRSSGIFSQPHRDIPWPKLIRRA